MKHIILSLSLLLLVGCSSQPQTQQPVKKAEAPERKGWDNRKHPLYGDVESICTILYQRDINSAGEEVITCDTILQAYFNEQGDLIRKVNYHVEERATYNSRGELATMTTFNPEGEIITIYYYIYNEQGLLVEERHLNAEGELLQQYTYTHNSRGDLLQSDEQNSRGDLLTQTFNSYANEQLVERKSFFKGGILGSVLFSYDKQQRLSEEHYFLGDGTMGGLRRYTYDGVGNIIEDALYEGDATSPSLRYRYTYDAMGNRTSWSHNYPTDQGEEITEELYRYSYDAQQNVILSEGFLGAESVAQGGEPDTRFVAEITYRK